MQQRETFILKLVMNKEESGKQVSALLRSAKTSNEFAFSSMEKLIDYLKIWEIQAGGIPPDLFPTDDGFQEDDHIQKD